MKKTLLVSAIIVAFSFVGCTSDKVPFDVQERNQKIAKTNAKLNARVWKSERAPNYNISSQGDSTISSNCAQGDGWATVDLVRPHDWDNTVTQWTGAPKLTLTCSTVSQGRGCLPKNEFKTKTYSNQEGKCNHELPEPLPKFEE